MPGMDERTWLAVGVEDEGGNAVPPSSSVQERASAAMWYAVVVAIVGPTLWGWTIGFTSPTFSVSDDPAYIKPHDLNYAFAISSSQKSWLSSSIMLAAAVGALLVGKIIDVVGKKIVIVACNALFLLGNVVFRATPTLRGPAAAAHGGSNSTSGAPVDNTHVMAQLLAARILMGVAGGVACAAIPAYTVEIAPLKQRGLVGCVFQLGVNLGLASVYSIGYTAHWDVLCDIAIVLAGVGTCASVFITESPQWLVNKGRRVDAEVALARLRTKDTDCMALLDSYTVVKTASEETIQARGNPVAELLKYPRNKALAMALGLVLAQQFSGINVVMCFGGEIIGKVYPDPNDANKYAMIMQVLMFATVVAASAIMPLANRRTFLIAAEVGMLVSFAMMVAYFYNETGVPKEVVLIGYFAFPITFSFGMGSIPWLALGELLHPRVRGLASAICTFVSWMVSFFTVQTVDTFQHVFGGDADGSGSGSGAAADGRGIGGLFAMYAGLCFIGLMFIVFVLPETRDKSYNAVERELAGGH